MKKKSKQGDGKQASSSQNPEALHRRLPAGKDAQQDIADLVVEGSLLNATSLQLWGSELLSGTHGQKVDLTALAAGITDLERRVKDGSLGDAESMLITQASVLNTLFANLLMRASAKHVSTLELMDQFLRLAFKAQAQCRATCETLAVLKNPPVFAHQANIANGPQQINNATVMNGVRACAAIQKTAPNKLLEAAIDGERMDRREEGAAVAGDQTMTPVGTVDRTSNGERESPISQKRVSLRGAARYARDHSSAQRDSRGAA